MNEKSHTANIVVIGAGYWGKNLVRNFYELGHLYGVADLDKTKKDLCPPEVKFYEDYFEALQDVEVNAVAIATPTETHYKVAMAAMHHGLHVYIEKPMCPSLREAEKLTKSARGIGVVLMVGHILEYHPAFMKLKEIVEAGTLGKISHVYSVRAGFVENRNKDHVLWDLAIHDLSVILGLIKDEPRYFVAHGDEHTSMISLEFPRISCQILAGKCHPENLRHFTVIGDEKIALVKEGSSEIVLMDHNGNSKQVVVNKEEPLKIECAHFINCIEESQTPITDGLSALRIIKILEECIK